MDGYCSRKYGIGKPSVTFNLQPLTSRTCDFRIVTYDFRLLTLAEVEKSEVGQSVVRSQKLSRILT